MNDQSQNAYPPEFIRPLSEAENEFLQVLITDFQLKNRGRGLELAIAFQPDSPAIWLRKARTYLLQMLSRDHRQKYQAIFIDLMSQGAIDYRHSDPAFPFRFGNGGSLPVVGVGQKDYYCLFYRDAHPVGWNIANGGVCGLNDLLHPDAIIERELREELIIIEPECGRRYVFDWHNARLKDHPDFALANELWMARFRRRNYPDFSEITLPLKWIPAPDTSRRDSAPTYDSVQATFADGDPIYTGHGFLNITGEDFAIEFDRIAKLAVGPDSVFRDGEIVRGRLLDRVIGLFDVERFNKTLTSGETRFVPERLFGDGKDRTGDDMETVIAGYLRPSEITSEHQDDDAAEISLDLCPVTRNIINRYMRLSAKSTPAEGGHSDKRFDVFISFASEDSTLATQVYNRLKSKGDRRVFFSDVTMDHGPFARQIDHALDTSWALVAVGSRIEHLYKDYVQYEWETFHNDMLTGRKHPRTPFVAFVAGVDPRDLPRPFRYRQAVSSSTENLDEGLHRLSGYIERP